MSSCAADIELAAPCTPTPCAGRASTTAAAAAPSTGAARDHLYLLFLFASWFAIDVVYNISNKTALQMVDFQLSLTAFHFLFGAVYYALLWSTAIRAAPVLALADVVQLLPLAALTMTTHLSAVVAVYLGSVSFMHIVKSGEPLFAAILAAIVLRERYPAQVYASLVPVVLGIGVASYSEHGFDARALAAALASAAAASLRGIYSKKMMKQPIGANLTASNLYGVLTIMAFLIILVPTLVIEAPIPTLLDAWRAGVAKGHSSWAIAACALVSSATYTWFNEVSFVALQRISPVSYAVANTSKRTILIVSSVAWFGNRMREEQWVGGAVALAGVLAYSLVKLRYKAIPM